jgi:hypothetical protein
LKKTKEFGIKFYIRNFGVFLIKTIEEKEGESAEIGVCVRAQRGFFSPNISLWWPPGFVLTMVEILFIFRFSIISHTVHFRQEEDNSQIFCTKFQWGKQIK